MGQLDGQVAIISGGARGQGEAEARLFAREGAAVVLGDILDEDGQRVAESIIDAGGQAAYVHLDVTSETDWSDIVDKAVAEFGRVDLLLNNAGILPVATIEHATLEHFREVVDVNLVGVFLGIRAVIAAMREAGGGCIINTSSTAGIQGYPGLGAYASSKFAVRGLTKVAAVELGGDNIRVNSVHPGPIDTPMLFNPDAKRDEHGDRPMRIPISRMGRADEIAKMMLFIAADATYSTGSEFIVDGGLTASSNLNR
ncbi:MAG: glucose 1-dehydrogenase [Chloroflexi bacterium]|nr:glucose 1-dehydrogenase [Chloroflexota bacterium]MYB23067.1 glucose 1-dehydrogenase [Chloroflexota bacterium]MYF21660.1 glucose 1-dehydrogenase [Chloroflexota bacterium]MYF81630.1 glucose 1-dehydrogenase [Chloroflexota bacterium]MYI04987.1 glucose 1-dehydrogenase [Chloroflexota bacterium]